MQTCSPDQCWFRAFRRKESKLGCKNIHGKVETVRLRRRVVGKLVLLWVTLTVIEVVRQCKRSNFGVSWCCCGRSVVKSVQEVSTSEQFGDLFIEKESIRRALVDIFERTTTQNELIGVVWRGEWVHWDRHTLSASWYFFFFEVPWARSRSNVSWTMRNMSQCNWIVVVVIKMVGAMCVGIDWAKKQSEQVRGCVARLNVWFRLKGIFRRAVGHRRKVDNDDF